MERRVEIARVLEIARRERVIDCSQCCRCSDSILGSRLARALCDCCGLDREAQAEHFEHLARRDRADLKSTVRKDVDEPLGAKLHERLANGDLADAEFCG